MSLGLLLLYFLFLQTIQAALRDEALFFQKNYPALASRNGTPFLARTLNKVYTSSDWMIEEKDNLQVSLCTASL